jgi:hypothetical protein
MHPFRHELTERLWTSESKEQLYQRMDGICATYPEFTSWLKSKRVPWIVSGLMKSESLVPLQYWEYARKHTGISESSHFQENNFTGRKTTLLNAVLK